MMDLLFLLQTHLTLGNLIVGIPGFLLGAGIIGSVIGVPMYDALNLAFFGSSYGIEKPLISQSLCGSPFTPNGFYGGIFDLLAVAMVASLLLTVIIYFIGKIFENSQLVSYMKTELVEILITFGIIAFAIGLIILPCNINVVEFMIFPESGHFMAQMNAYESAFFFAQFSEIALAANLSINIILNVMAMFFLKATIGMNIFGGIQNLPAYQGITLSVKPILTELINASSLTYIISVVQIILYEVLTYGAVKYILPLGFLLRVFAPFKKLGGVLIAFALSGVIFYTAMLNIGWIVGKGYMVVLPKSVVEHSTGYLVETEFEYDRGGSQFSEFGRIVVQAPNKVVELAEEANQAINDPSVSEDSETYGKIIKDNEELLRKTESSASQSRGFFSDLIGGLFKDITVLCGSSVILGAILPAVSFLVAITGTRFLAKFLGEDLDISNLTRVI